MRDPYEVLGVDREATQDEIKKAYRNLAMEHHPDRNDGDGSNWQPIDDAYTILKDTDKRKEYDETGSISQAAKPEDAALQKLVSLFFDIASNNNWRKARYVEGIRGRLQSYIVQGRTQIHEDKKLIYRMSEIAPRTEDEDNIFLAAIQQKQAMVQDCIDHNEKSLELHLLALDLLDKYEDQIEAGQISPTFSSFDSAGAWHTPT